MQSLLTALAVVTATHSPVVITPASAAKPARPPAVSSATVTVENDRNVAMTVFLEQGNFNVKLGSIAPDQTATWQLPSWVSNYDESVQFYLEPRKGTSLESQELQMQPGAHIGLLVPPGNGLADVTPRMTAVLSPADEAATTVTVQNDKPGPIAVDLEQGDFDIRLGSVPARSMQTLRVPQWMVLNGGLVQVFLHTRAGDDLSSSTFELHDGAHYGVQVPTRS